MVGSFDNFLIVFHALRLLCVILVNVMTSSHLPFISSINLSIILFPDSMVQRQKCCFNGSSCMLHIDILVGQFDRERILFDIYYVCYLPRIVDDQFLIPIACRPSSMLHQYPNNGGGGLEHTSAPRPPPHTFDIGGAETPCPRFLRLCGIKVIEKG